MEEENRKCKQCGEIKPLIAEFWVKDKGCIGGFRPVCKACLRGESGVEKRKAKEGYKICSRCKAELPATTEYFSKHSQCLDGLNTACKDCINKYYRSKRTKKHNKPKSRAKTNDVFLKQINDLWGDEFTILEPYIKAHTKIKVRHNVCGKEIYKTPNSLLKGHGCRYCQYEKLGMNSARTTDQYKQEVFNIVGNEYTVMGEYTTNNTPIKMRHNTCGNIWYPNPTWFLKGTRCPECMYKLNGEKRTMTHKEFTDRVYAIEGDEYEVISQYKKSDVKIKMKHNLCGTIYEVDPAMFLSGNRCPICTSLSKSNGETIIYKYLNSRNINFKSEYKIDDCANVLPLPFDFAIFHDDKLIGLIEFDGIQHFKPVKAFGGEKSFQRQKINDNIKNNYCKEKQIPLLRISYRKIRKIHEILDKYLDSLGF